MPPVLTTIMQLPQRSFREELGLKITNLVQPQLDVGILGNEVYDSQIYLFNKITWDGERCRLTHLVVKDSNSIGPWLGLGICILSNLNS